MQALEEMLAICREHGFHCENHGNIVGSIGGEEKHWDNLIGFWNHLDIVPTGNGWENGPFDPVVKNRFLIGRGVQDNKGPAVGILYVMECLRELKVPLKHELCLFVGTDEERGMEDMEYYTAHYPAPKLSMTPDSGFPVCYGEKGILEGQMVTEGAMSAQVLEARGGNASNMIPDRAWAVLADREELLAELSRLCGAEVGIAYRDQVSGQTTCAGTVLAMEEGHLSLILNIRYAITAKDQEDIAALTAYGAANGIRFRLERNSRPGYFPKEHPAVDILTDVYNELTGSDAKSYVMGGGHEPDEALNLRLFVEAMKIYAYAIAALNDVEL